MRCWPADAEAAWEARRGLARSAELIEESHFHVMLLVCPACDQRYVSVFTETIDWADGDDPQHWSLLPVTAAEAAGLLLQRDSLTEAALAAPGRGRRCLQQDHPEGVPPRTFWAIGVTVGPHD